MSETTNPAALARAEDKPFFTPEQERMIRDSFLNGASREEAAVLMEVARARKLNPITRQIHFVKRWDSRAAREIWSHQTSIDGLRAIAERTGLYAGQDEPEWLFEGKQLIGAKVKVYRKDWARPAVGVAWWLEFVPINPKTQQPTRMWQQMPRLMIAKCAEALALRKAFPEDTGGLYIAEEMQQADQPDGGKHKPAQPPIEEAHVVAPPSPKPAQEPPAVVAPPSSAQAVVPAPASVPNDVRGLIPSARPTAREPGEGLDEPTDYDLLADRLDRLTTSLELSAARKQIIEAKKAVTREEYAKLQVKYEGAKARIGGR